MATQTKTRSTRKTATAKAGTSRAKTSAKATGKGKTTAKPAADGPTKRELLAEQNEAHTERIVELRDADTSWSEIAEELKITSGKAQYLMMCHLVANDEVPAITFRNEGELVKKVAAARAKADEYSSWGWLSARASVPHTKLQKLMAEEGLYETNAENIAAIRAERNGTTKKGNAVAKGKPAATKRTTAAAKKTTATSAKATAARKRAARTAGKGKTS